MAGRLKIFTCIIVNPGLNWTFYIPHGLFFLCGETFYCAEGDRIFFFLLSSWLCLLPDFLRLRSAHWHLRSIFGLMGPMPKFVRPDSGQTTRDSGTSKDESQIHFQVTWIERGSQRVDDLCTTIDDEAICIRISDHARFPVLLLSFFFRREKSCSSFLRFDAIYHPCLTIDSIRVSKNVD